MNLEEIGVIVLPLLLASSRLKCSITSLVSEGSVVLGFQNLASGDRGLLPES
jgi:hypothetical protein